MSLKSCLIGGAAVVVASTAAFLLGATRPDEPPPAHHAAATPAERRGSERPDVPSLSEFRTAIRAAVRDELRQSNSVAEPQEPPPEPVASPEPSPEAKARFEQAREVIATALRQRVWNEASADQLRQLYDQLEFAQQGQILAQLVPAVNRGDLAVETHGPLF